jgi:hypothetical protein
MNSIQGTSLAGLSAFLVRLETAHICYQLASIRDGAVMVQVTVPGERWEIEFFPDSPPEVEVFRSRGDIAGEDTLERLFAEHGD